MLGAAGSKVVLTFLPHWPPAAAFVRESVRACNGPQTTTKTMMAFDFAPFFVAQMTNRIFAKSCPKSWLYGPRTRTIGSDHGDHLFDVSTGL